MNPGIYEKNIRNIHYEISAVLNPFNKIQQIEKFTEECKNCIFAKIQFLHSGTAVRLKLFDLLRSAFQHSSFIPHR